MEKTDEELREFCKGQYYSDIQENLLWEPFENWEQKDIDKQIDCDVKSLKEFMYEKRTCSNCGDELNDKEIKENKDADYDLCYRCMKGNGE